MNTLRSISILAMILLAGVAHASVPQGTSFTYQGELKANGTPVNGTVDARFTLFTDAAGTQQVGLPICINDVEVVEGRFTRTLDFGEQFQGAERFLQVSVRPDPQGATLCEDAAPYTDLLPRHAITPAPAAISARMVAIAPHASTADQADSAQNALTLENFPVSNTLDANMLTGTLPSTALGGTYAQQVTLGNIGNVLKGDGAGITNVSPVHANVVGTAATASLADNTTQLNGQPAATYLRFNNLTGALPPTIEFESVLDPVNLNNTFNTYIGAGGALRLSAAGFTQGTLPNSALSGTYTQPVQFINAANVLKGSGAGLTNIDPLNITGRLDRARVNDMFFTVNKQNSDAQVGLNNSELVGSRVTFTAPFAGRATLVYHVSGYNAGPGALWMIVRPIVDTLQLPPESGLHEGNFYFNEEMVHQSMCATSSWNIAAGQHTLYLSTGVEQGSGSQFRRDNNDQVSWSLIITRN